MDFPKSVPGVGLVDGKFVDENQATGLVGSLIPSAWGNAVTGELLNAIRAANLVPSEENDAQLLQAVRRLSGGYLAKNIAGGLNVALTEAESQNTVLAFSGALTSNVSVSVPPLGRGWKVINATSGAFTLTLKTVDGSGVVVEQGKTVDAYCDGVNVSLVAAAAVVPVAAIQPFATSAPPSGWLKANGAAVSRATYASLFAALVTAAGFTPQAFTVTLANPAVFTKAAHGLQNGARVRLATAGALPTGLNSTTDYFVEVINADTFYLSLTLMGARIATSGAQNGVHTFLQSWFGLGDGATTFNLPDLRGEFLRGWDDGRGVDYGRVFGSVQMDDFKSHDHVAGSYGSAYGSGATAYGGVGLPAGADKIWTNTKPTGGAETRPRNVAILVCIKY